MNLFFSLSLNECVSKITVMYTFTVDFNELIYDLQWYPDIV